MNECLSAALLTPVDKREEFYHLACWLKIDLLVNFLNYFIFVLLIILHHTVEYAQLQIFMLIIVLAWIFVELFPTDLKSASNSASFYTHIKLLWKKYLWGHISTFYELWILMHTKQLKIMNFFSNVNQNKLYFPILVSKQQGVKIISP